MDRVEQRAATAPKSDNNSQEETTNAAHQQPNDEDSMGKRHMVYNQPAGFIQASVPVDTVGVREATPPLLASTLGRFDIGELHMAQESAVCRGSI